MQKQQTMAVGETLRFDHTFDIPVEVATAVCTYHHDRWKFEWGKPHFTPALCRNQVTSAFSRQLGQAGTGSNFHMGPPRNSGGSQK
jgi:hypothetical protein